MKIVVNEIFESISGEVNYFGQGAFMTFVRLQGCTMNCSYCDTQYARQLDMGMRMETEEVVSMVNEYRSKIVMITGGEPLIQAEAVYDLASKLICSGYFVVLETNGTQRIPDLQMNLLSSVVMDFKLIGDKHPKSPVIFDPFFNLRPQDFVKFVIWDRKSFNEAVWVIPKLRALGCKAAMAFSPCLPKLDPQELVQWIRMEGLQSQVIFNLQIHKFIWSPETRGV